MYTIAPHLDALPILYEQHRLYTEELGNTHAALSRTYKKLARTERKLNDQESKPSRAQAKRLWWTRTVAKQSIEKLEAQKEGIYSLLQQCRDLIISYNHEAYMSQATSFWTTYFPPTPAQMAAFTPHESTPWTAGSYRGPFVGQQTQQPQYWDLSMLKEQTRGASPADSGFHETESVRASASEQVGTHEHMSSSYCSATAAASSSGVSSDGSEKDGDSEVSEPAIIHTGRAIALHYRRFSEDAVRQVDQRPRLSKEDQGGVSAMPGTSSGRTVTAPEVQTLFKKDT